MGGFGALLTIRYTLLRSDGARYFRCSLCDWNRCFFSRVISLIILLIFRRLFKSCGHETIVPTSGSTDCRVPLGCVYVSTTFHVSLERRVLSNYHLRHNRWKNRPDGYAYIYAIQQEPCGREKKADEVRWAETAAMSTFPNVRWVVCQKPLDPSVDVSQTTEVLYQFFPVKVLHPRSGKGSLAAANWVAYSAAFDSSIQWDQDLDSCRTSFPATVLVWLWRFHDPSRRTFGVSPPSFVRPEDYMFCWRLCSKFSWSGLR